jgi:hypothetical protein
MSVELYGPGGRAFVDRHTTNGINRLAAIVHVVVIHYQRLSRS